MYSWKYLFQTHYADKQALLTDFYNQAETPLHNLLKCYSLQLSKNEHGWFSTAILMLSE